MQQRATHWHETRSVKVSEVWAGDAELKFFASPHHRNATAVIQR